MSSSGLTLFQLHHTWGWYLIPFQIVTCLTVDYNKHCFLQFGKYVQVHESHEKMMQERATGAIALSPTSNSQGEYLFMSLATGMILNHQSFTLLPLSQDIINSVHRFAYRNPRGLDIRYIYRRPFLEADYRANNGTNSSTYALSNKESSKNGDESNEHDYDTDKNINPPPDQEMEQGPT